MAERPEPKVPEDPDLRRLYEAVRNGCAYAGLDYDYKTFMMTITQAILDAEEYGVTESEIRKMKMEDRNDALTAFRPAAKFRAFADNAEFCRELTRRQEEAAAKAAAASDPGFGFGFGRGAARGNGPPAGGRAPGNGPRGRRGHAPGNTPRAGDPSAGNDLRAGGPAAATTSTTRAARGTTGPDIFSRCPIVRTEEEELAAANTTDLPGMPAPREPEPTVFCDMPYTLVLPDAGEEEEEEEEEDGTHRVHRPFLL
ncbi:hypothetical protein VTK56DRAFT_9520 [Thermocarpiscus australiensis]